MDDFSFTKHARDIADRFVVPDGLARDLLRHLGDLLDSELSALDLIVVHRAYDVTLEAVREVYEPQSPLAAQLEHDRARKDLAMQGIDVPPWVAAEDPVVLERWAEWIRRGGDSPQE